MIEGQRSRREREASAQSAHVAERASVVDGACVSVRSVRTPRLSEGVVVEASLIARLLRWKLLTLDASIVLLPASAPRGDDGIVVPQRASGSRRGAARPRLPDAIRTIEQAENELTLARLTNHTAAP